MPKSWEHLRREYNAAVANNLILKARAIKRRMDAVARNTEGIGDALVTVELKGGFHDGTWVWARRDQEVIYMAPEPEPEVVYGHGMPPTAFSRVRPPLLYRRRWYKSGGKATWTNNEYYLEE